jgi:predicted RNA binding protein YcfA (HicA-like mRNA interferase family)
VRPRRPNWGLYGDGLDNTTYTLYIEDVVAKEVAAKLGDHGWVLDRVKGSHYIYAKGDQRSIPVPFHGNRDLGILGKRILKEAGINDQEL